MKKKEFIKDEMSDEIIKVAQKMAMQKAESK